MPEKNDSNGEGENVFQSYDLVDYEMVDFEASHDHDVKEMLLLSDSMTQKVIFTIFSANIALTGFLSGSIPHQFYIFHSMKTITLLLYRWYSYKMIKNHYFMFDFCYYTNFLLLIYIWSPWQFGILFPILFGLCNGPLLWSVLLWRNSLVPHSVDKMTSLLLHLSPALTTWGLKWYSTIDQGFLLCAGSTTSDQADQNSAVECDNIGMIELILSPIICSLLWVTFYYIFILVWRAERIKQREYVNSYTYLVVNAKKKPLIKMFNMFGQEYKKIMYLVWHTVYILLSLMIAYYSYFSQVYHFVLISVILLIACYNGASFYIDVIGRLYYEKKEVKKE